MTTISPRLSKSTGRDRVLPDLDALIRILDVAKAACIFPPAQAAIDSTSALIKMIRGTMANKGDYVELGRSCGQVCQVLDRGLKGRSFDELSSSVTEAIGQLITTVAEIQRKIVEKGQRNLISRVANARNDKDTIVAWGRNLDRILNIFNTELLLNNHTILLDLRRDAQAVQAGTDDRHQSAQPSVPLGELPPSPPRACFGRDELIERIIGLAESLIPIALIGPGGIGKTSVALAVLHNDRIKDRFGDNRRFIRCDKFTPSLPNFLNRLSKVIGAGVDNPEDLTSLQPSLSSKGMFLIIDNAESILDPRGPDGREIYGVVKELSKLDNVCLCITSRITTVPPDCKCLDVPTLSMDAAHSTFYRIYDNDEQSGRIDEILSQLDFHPLSLTLLATVAHQNKWDGNRLMGEWEQHHTGVLQTEHSESLAVTIELSLASPMFQQLGPDARALLGVVAFFPQGVDENNLEWLFPTISSRKIIFDRFCMLSLTYRSNGFITMLAPLRDHLCPKDPKGSPLLCATKDLYVTRLSGTVGPDLPGFEDTLWITSEDVNVEHLFDVFTSVDPSSDGTWIGCNGFMARLHWHKPRQTVLGPKIEQLPDDHRYKPVSLFELSRLLERLGNYAEHKRLLTHALKLWRERGSEYLVARALHLLASANRALGLYEEGTQQAKEALGVFEKLGPATDQVACLIVLAELLWENDQLDEAEEVITRAINLLENGPEFSLCRFHRILGHISRARGDTEKAIHHYNIAIGIASKFNWTDQLFWIHYSLATMFHQEHEFDNATTNIKQAKLHALHDEYQLGRAMEVQAQILYQQKRFEDGVSEASGAIKIYEKLGAVVDLRRCRDLLQNIGRAKEG